MAALHGFQRTLNPLPVLLALGLILWGAACAWATDTAPLLNDGQKWRIAYYEGGPWPDYKDTVMGLVLELMEMGWLEPAPVPGFADDADMRQVWQWLGNEVGSDYLEFPPENFYTADWDETKRTTNKQAFLNRAANKEFDLIWALGTWAGLDLANGQHSVPTQVMSTSNPIIAGIIPNPEESGHDHVQVRNDPTRVYRQVLLFHDIFAFSRLGLIYEDTKYGRAYAYLDEVQAASLDRGFELVTCIAANEEGEAREAMEEYQACVKSLAPIIDAFIYDDHNGGTPEQVGKTLPVFVEYKVPTWSTRGEELVGRGVLIALAAKDFRARGVILCNDMARILNGTLPGDLEQIYRNKFRLSINLEMARLIGWEVPRNLLSITDRVFETIVPPLELTNHDPAKKK